MPIKPENRSLYPPDWHLISAAAKSRANYRCQHPGCSARQYAVGRWLTGAQQWLEMREPPESYGDARQRAAEISFSLNGDGPGEFKIIVIVLTVAHLNHDPTDCRPENLAAMCQRHHLAYDQQHHNETAYSTRMAKRNNLELPLAGGSDA